MNARSLALFCEAPGCYQLSTHVVVTDEQVITFVCLEHVTTEPQWPDES